MMNQKPKFDKLENMKTIICDWLDWLAEIPKKKKKNPN